MISIPWLSWAIWLPILGAMPLLGMKGRPYHARCWAIVLSILSLLVTIPLLTYFDQSTAYPQFVEYMSWLPYFNIYYHLGVDGISVLFVVLNSFITVLIALAAKPAQEGDTHYFLAAFLVLSGVMNGIFSALDGLLFYIFFEVSLIPMYLIIGIWGGPRRVYAAFKFFLFTLLGSLLMLIALIYLFILSGYSFSLSDWQAMPITLPIQILLFLAFFIAFAVKVPMWPVHTWLPDAHVEAPTAGSIVLAAIMLKLGAYGFLRFSLPILPEATRMFSPLIIGLSLVAIIYIGFIALVQTDMKKLIAYSSISHMGFVTLGFFLLTAMGIEGALVQMISHGFISAAMFFCVGILYERIHSREISDYGGVVNTMPRFAAFFVLFAMANAGLPGTSGFVGEFMVIVSSMQYNFWVAAAAATTLILGAAYTLWMIKRVVFGPVQHDAIANLKDITTQETLVLSVLAILVLAFGIYPLPLTEFMHESVSHLVNQVLQTKF